MSDVDVEMKAVAEKAVHTIASLITDERVAAECYRLSYTVLSPFLHQRFWARWDACSVLFDGVWADPEKLVHLGRELVSLMNAIHKPENQRVAEGMDAQTVAERVNTGIFVLVSVIGAVQQRARGLVDGMGYANRVVCRGRKGRKRTAVAKSNKSKSSDAA